MKTKKKEEANSGFFYYSNGQNDIILEGHIYVYVYVCMYARTYIRGVDDLCMKILRLTWLKHIIIKILQYKHIVSILSLNIILHGMSTND